MTEKEADYWDEYYTKNTIMPDMGKHGFFARKYGVPVKLEPETTGILADSAVPYYNFLAQKSAQKGDGK